jgi:hypothetical protein
MTISALRSKPPVWPGAGGGIVAALTHESGEGLFTSVVLIHQHSGFGAPFFVIICQAFAPFETISMHAVQHASFEAD